MGSQLTPIPEHDAAAEGAHDVSSGGVSHFVSALDHIKSLFADDHFLKSHEVNFSYRATACSCRTSTDVWRVV